MIPITKRHLGMLSASPRSGSLLGLHITRRLHLRVDSPTFDACHLVSGAIRPKYFAIVSAFGPLLLASRIPRPPSHWGGNTNPHTPTRLSRLQHSRLCTMGPPHWPQTFSSITLRVVSAFDASLFAAQSRRVQVLLFTVCIRNNFFVYILRVVTV